MEAFLFEWIAICTVMLLGVISPGPDFVVAVRHGVIYSRRTGLLTALGFGLGVLIHVAYCMLGIAAIIASSITAFNVIKIAGAAFLIFIGYKALRSKGFNDPSAFKGLKTREDISARKAVQIGFLTNLLNPKATLFFLALFTQVISPETPINVQLVYGASCFVIVTGWFSFVAFVLTAPRVKSTFLKSAKWIDRISGGVMIALGVRLLWTKPS